MTTARHARQPCSDSLDDALPASTDWVLAYEGFDAGQEALREALCTLGNGYVATRGAAPESSADDVHYPGTYLAGGYDRLTTSIAGREVTNEDLVNIPNWLVLRYRIGRGRWLETRSLVEAHQELDLRRGVLTRRLRFRDRAGRLTRVTQRRFISMRDPHFAGLETTFVAENWSGPLTVRSGLDGGVVNGGVARYRALRGDHLEPPELEVIDRETVLLATRTRGSRVRVAEAARTRVCRDGSVIDGSRRRVVRDAGQIGDELRVELAEGVPLTVEKVVAIHTSRDNAAYEPAIDATETIRQAPGFDELLGRHVLAWARLWRRFDIRIAGPERAQVILRLHIFHLLQVVSENTVDLDVGVPARGLHGEAYRGHIFWDELFILPFLNVRLPVLSRALLSYRYRRLTAAREAAAEAGFRGAMYPWQSGSSGREESQTLHLNPRSGRWLPDNSHLQRHIAIAIAYNVWLYWETTGDLEFLRFRGAPMILEIARFLADLATYDRVKDRFEIRGVMGPDEYHDAYPNADTPGIDNNAYTNVMSTWVMQRAIGLIDLLPEHHGEELLEDLQLGPGELERWEHISRRMFVPFHDGVISQFEGYEKLRELDWDDYRRRYGDIQRLDRILEAEGDTPNRYRASKQADVLMLFYLLSSDELTALLDRLGYAFDPVRDPRRTIEYYLARTSNGSTLSRLVSAWVVARLDRERSWTFFLDALESDVGDTQGGSTAEGIHLGAMAGTVDFVQRGFTGLEMRDGVLRLDPRLPDEMPSLGMSLHYRGHRLEIEIDRQRLHVRARPGPAAPIDVVLCGTPTTLHAGDSVEVDVLV